MQCYTELVAPSAVTHAISLPFLSSFANNLIVIRLSLLQIFEFNDQKSHQTTSTVANSAATSQSTTLLNGHSQSSFPAGSKCLKDGTKSNLVLYSEHQLSGTVTDVAAVKLSLSKYGGKAILIAFRDAKMSLVTWDPETSSISTVSIHYYEGEGIIHNPVLPSITQCSNFLAVDPNDQCAVLKFGSRHVAVLPFKQKGDDILETEYDHEFDELGDHRTLVRETDGAPPSEQPEVPFQPSYVLPLTVLDSVLNIPIHFAFLHEYREPTFGILFSKKHPSITLLPHRRDPVCYAVYSLDLEHRTSTSLLSVSGLPYDLCEVVPLRLPVGGSLLVGTNELVHVDQAGKVLGVAVNSFAAKASFFKMLDYSSLALHLEGCVIQPLATSSSDILLALSNGTFALVTFKLDGRSVSRMEIQMIDQEHIQDPHFTSVSCSSLLPNNHIFYGSIDGDSILYKWHRVVSQLPKKRAFADISDHEDGIVDVDDMDDFEDFDDDDLYATSKPKTRDSHIGPSTEPLGADELYLTCQDTLPSLTPIHDFTTRPSLARSGEARKTSTLDLYALVGTGPSTSIAAMSRKLYPKVDSQSSYPRGTGIWTIPVIKAGRGGGTGSSGAVKTPTSPTASSVQAIDEYLYISRSRSETPEPGIEILTLDSPKLDRRPLGDFDPESGPTIEIGLLGEGTRVVQVLDTEVRTYDSSFDLSQIMPIENESGEELRIKAAYFCDPYMLLLREDASLMLLVMDSAGELDEKEVASFKGYRWLSGCLFRSAFTNDIPMAFLLTDEGALVVFDLGDVTAGPKYVAESLCDLPYVLVSSQHAKSGTVKEPLCELLVANIGPDHLQFPYMILRNVHDDLFLYKPFFFLPPGSEPSTGSNQFNVFGPSLRWQRVNTFFGSSETSLASDPNPVLPVGQTQLRSLSRVSGYNVVVRTGSRPAIFIREASSPVRMLEIDTKPIASVTALNCPALSHGFALLDTFGKIQFCKLPKGRFGDTGWAVCKIDFGIDAKYIRYHASQDVFAVGAFTRQPFKLPPDDYHPEWEDETTEFPPNVEQGIVKLLDGECLEEVDSWRFEQNEVITCLEVVDTVVSEITGQRKTVIAVGTAVILGEDLVQAGYIYIFDVVHVVPKPSCPKTTNRRLKLLLREMVKGGVTAVSEIGTQGFLLVVHGQKCMVRGLKEDGTFLPTAFMDLQCYVPSAKTIPGTGMVALADAIKGVWFVGYTEDPYKMLLFGKSQTALEVTATEFLPAGDQLFILAVDADGFLHLFEFAPEDPKSVSGQRLLERSSFFLGNSPTRLLRLPGLPGPDGTPNPTAHQVLAATEFGGLWKISSIPSEGSYRNLHTLQTYLTLNLHHPCGLNPRAYRQVETDGFGSRGILDGGLLSRWYELPTAKRAESSGRVGALEQELRRDLKLATDFGRLGYI